MYSNNAYARVNAVNHNNSVYFSNSIINTGIIIGITIPGIIRGSISSPSGLSGFGRSRMSKLSS